MAFPGFQETKDIKDLVSEMLQLQPEQEIRRPLEQQQQWQQEKRKPSTAPPRVVVNPYRVKRKRTPLAITTTTPISSFLRGSEETSEAIEKRASHTNQEDPLGFSLHHSSRSCRADNDNDDRDEGHCIKTTTSAASAETATTTATSSVGRTKNIEATVLDNGNLKPATIPSRSFSTSDPRWKRLPSKNVSFGSGEILSVTELIQRAHQYCHRSVRVTGVLKHRLVLQQDGNANHVHDHQQQSGILVSLVLTDPLVSSSSKTKKRPRSSLLSSARRISFGKSPAVVSTTSETAASSSTTSRTSSSDTTAAATLSCRTPICKPKVLLTTPAVLKTPAASTSSTNSFTGEGKSSLLSSMRSTTPAINCATTPRYTGLRKRPLSSSAFRTPGSSVKAVVDDVAENMGVWIVVNPVHVTSVNDCAVGDLVMVIGEVGTFEDDDMSRVGPDHEIRYILQEIINRKKEQEKEDGSYIDNRLTVHHVRARIVKNVNGTNMQLQHEALQLRRRTAPVSSSSNTDNGHNLQTDVNNSVL